MAKGIKLNCGHCDNSVAFIYSPEKVAEIASDWRCCNGSLVCPACRKTWNEQTDGLLGDTKTTAEIIDTFLDK